MKKTSKQLVLENRILIKKMSKKFMKFAFNITRLAIWAKLIHKSLGFLMIEDILKA